MSLQRRLFFAEVPLEYFAHPSEITAAMAFLSRDDASYVRYPFKPSCYVLISSGATLKIDGGHIYY
jgi:NAD(P)-dependent dehydrogenase (short-subunit alcohol dehydrogenase family)